MTTKKPDRFAEIAKAVVFDVESFHDYGQKEKILALALREAAANAFAEAAELAGLGVKRMQDKNMDVAEVSFDLLKGDLEAKAAALRETKA